MFSFAGHKAGRTERVVPYTLFGDIEGDMKGRGNFLPGKTFTIYAAPDGSEAGSLQYAFQFKDCTDYVDPFDMSLDLTGVPPSDEAFFTDAQTKWQSVITDGYPGFYASGLTIPPDAGIAPGSDCAYPVAVDDIYMCAGYVPIDGPGFHPCNGRSCLLLAQ